MSPDRILRILLLFMGGVLLSAALFVFMPTSWMARTHEALGMGVFPDAALTQYLTRSIAALYATHGVFVLVAASDVRRYRGLARAIGATDMAFGAAMLGVDLQAGMPTWWTLLEGPPLVVVGGIVLVLARRVS